MQPKTNNDFNEKKNNDIIDEQGVRKLIKYNSICRRIYGNPEIHKGVIPLRPIIAGIT